MGSTLDGRIVLVTGGGRGIGAAAALQLAERGAKVVLLARSADQLTATAERITAAGGDVATVDADLSDLAAIPATAARAVEAFGKVDALVNNAALVTPMGPSVRVDPVEWATAVTVNVTALATLTFALLPPMLARGWGRIANVSTGAVVDPTFMVGGNAYVTTKTAVEAHSLNLASELTGTGVTVNVYRPGAVDTTMQDWVRAQGTDTVGPAVHAQFQRVHAEDGLYRPEVTAGVLVDRLETDDNGQVWNVTDWARPGATSS
jgi:NAD(P)-dependent dehydrogenase (short-subunit alcohol dehydrogenase family)